MEADKDRILYLLNQYVAKRSSAKEINELNHYFEQYEDDVRAVYEMIWQAESSSSEQANVAPVSPIEKAAFLAKLLATSDATQKTDEAATAQHRIGQRGFLARIAAVLFMVLMGGLFFYKFGSQSKTDTALISPQKTLEAQDRDPGLEKATLTLADGKSITLSAADTGIILQQDNFRLMKLATGEIAYKPVDGKSSSNTVHTITTPRGGQLSFILPDGSKVSLNAASSLRFSSDMATANRRVEMSGEAYFEVVKQQGSTFSVHGEFGDIRVLGTTFNVNAYDVNKTQTALLEGSVELTSGQHSVLMKPAEIAITDGENIKIRHSDNLADVISWTQGSFYFDDADMQTLASQLARWYNIDVEVHGNNQRKLTGKFNRNVKLSTMSEMLTYMGISSSFKNNKLIINEIKTKLPM